MTYEAFEICNCHCHDFPEGTVKHVMACCFQCPHCGANINRGYIEEHEQRCGRERLDLGLPLNQYNILSDLNETVMKEIQEAIAEDERQEIEERPAVKFLRECQERERKLGK